MILTGEFDSSTNLAVLNWTAYAGPNLANYTVRWTQGVPHDDDNDVLVATLPPTNTSLETQDGVFTPGSIASFKVFVVLTSGGEAGSNPVTIQHP